MGAGASSCLWLGHTGLMFALETLLTAPWQHAHLQRAPLLMVTPKATWGDHHLHAT